MMPLGKTIRLQVLLVEDDHFMKEMIYEMLLGLHIGMVDMASNGVDALRLMKDSVYQLIICDLNMPEMDGIQFFRHLANEKYQGSIIIVSAFDGQLLDAVAKLVEEHHLNLKGVLQKPFERDALIEVLKNIDIKDQVSNNKPRTIAPQMSVTELEYALNNGLVKPFFQPKICTNTGAVKSVECLARIVLEDGCIVSPLSFIEVAEKHNLIERLTFDIFKIALKQQSRWASKGIDLQFAVNLSEANLQRLHFPEMMAEIATENGVSTDKVTLEVTESSVSDNLLTSLDVMTRLRLQGFNLAIDDFGTGYSSIEKLRQLPFNELKVDRQFVSGALDKEWRVSILKHSVQLGKDLNMNVVAEGAETKEEYDFLCSLGCDEVQGFLFSKPLAPDDFEKWYKAFNCSN